MGLFDMFCLERVYAENSGYRDRACCLLIDEKKHFYYFKEVGNNKGYCMGNSVYEFDEESFVKYKNKEYDRNSQMTYLFELPAGDNDWLEDEDFLKKLVDLARGNHTYHMVNGRFMPVFYHDLKDYRINMHTASGENYSFVLSGTYLDLPNRCSTCGYGEDVWRFICKCEGKDGILEFADNASCGTMWSFVYISEEDARRLPALPDLDWLHVTFDNAAKVMRGLHPDSVDCAKQILKRKYSRTGELSDNKVYGWY